MVKFLKLPVLFRQVIYLMNKTSLSISLPPSFPHLFCQRSKHALTPRFCSLVWLQYGGVSCEPHSSVQMLPQCLLCAEEPLLTTICIVFTKYSLGGCPTRAELQKKRESPCFPGSPGLWSSTAQAPALLCYVFGELHNISQRVLSIVKRCKGLEEKNVKIWKYPLILTLTHILTSVS